MIGLYGLYKLDYSFWAINVQWVYTMRKLGFLAYNTFLNVQLSISNSFAVSGQFQAFTRCPAYVFVFVGPKLFGKFAMRIRNYIWNRYNYLKSANRTFLLSIHSWEGVRNSTLQFFSTFIYMKIIYSMYVWQLTQKNYTAQPRTTLFSVNTHR